ncbi:PA1136 family autoinducer-binding transcriptional regulator [Pseudomonas chlororaphis]|uniref:PA1136 family autoinducer-binding transcriptional regulator n=1 Tax=Pseudomonas chlororaphis TaxID=587753 RepID=UPI00026E46FA|nr:PA1136 family autoinducer-binding transcriptional regulator [Pseudomonas chlororaphis]EJL05941.1 LuxR family transcriptional regulatory protein, chaperone HchA-associated [Pseudomonas chlororaphis subsp. aureofaciens 30-84]
MNDGPAEAAIRAALEIEAAQTLESIQKAVRGFATSYGYDRFVLFSASSASEEVVERIYWVEGDWFGDNQGVDAEDYVRRCPVSRHILYARESFFWKKLQVEGGERYQVVRSPRGPGVQGLQVPVFGPQGLEGAMSLGGEQVDGSPQVRLGLGIVATAAFFCARKLLEAPMGETIRKLSQREREVLAWTAAGLRQIDIARTLGLSERTVENHLRSARRRLGVTTTAQAIKIAIRNGEIDG